MEDYDKNNICFICNLEKYVFLKNSLGFEQHITNEHNLWNYVFFMYNLKHKSLTDMNGIESYIHQKIYTDDITWIPLRRALSLEHSEDKKEIMHCKIKLLEENLNNLQKDIKEEDNKI